MATSTLAEPADEAAAHLLVAVCAWLVCAVLDSMYRCYKLSKSLAEHLAEPPERQRQARSRFMLGFGGAREKKPTADMAAAAEDIAGYYAAARGGYANLHRSAGHGVLLRVGYDYRQETIPAAFAGDAVMRRMSCTSTTSSLIFPPTNPQQLSTRLGMDPTNVFV
jgi:hypothetical protein